MLKGRDLLTYALNEMGKDKLSSLHKIADDLVGLDDIAKRAITLIMPYNQYSFLEDIILGAKDSDQKLIDFLKSNGIALPLMYGWKHVSKNKGGGAEEIVDENEWFKDAHSCYCSMYKSAMRLIGNCVDCTDLETTIKTEGRTINITCGAVVDSFIMYEMD